MTEYRTLTLGEIDDEIVEMIEMIVDGYFVGAPLARDEMLDRLETHLVRRGIVLPYQMDDPVCKRVIAIARKAKKEVEG